MQLLTEVGNWISLPRDLVTSVADSTSASGYGRVIDTKTVFIGWAPNDAPSGLLEEEPVDSLSILLSYLESPDWSRQDFSVPQFVNT
ncbi:MAG: hypothetical protein GTO63_08130, partial [Anaerolineae bacterium]|nr:hypothetical protein [Anaerolineae bacterium]NIN94892.1 hypothetical protein [Anaerolineae bacterium]